MQYFTFLVVYYDDTELVAEENIQIEAKDFHAAYLKAEKKANKEKWDYGATHFTLA